MKNKNLLLTGIVILGFALTTLAQTVPSYVPTSGLVGWWPFTGNANDESGNNNNGTVNGASLTSDRNGNANAAYYFNGVSNYIQLPDNIKPSNISLSFWFKIASDKSDQKLIRHLYCGFEVTYNFTYSFASAGKNKLNSNIYTTSTAAYSQIYNTIVNDGKWHQLSFTFDGLYYKVYIDGVSVYQSNSLGTASVYYSSATNGFAIGRDGGASLFYYNGDFDDLGVWNRALTQQEISSLYYNCSPPTANITAESSTNFCQGGFVNLKANTGSGYTYQWYNNGNIIINATNSSYIITQSGNYTVKVTDGLCNATSSAVPVTVNANPSNAVTASGTTTFCSGNSVTLTAQGTGSYLWSNGATTKQITVNQTGNYFVVVTVNDCSSTSSPTNVVVNQAPTATITASGATTFCQGGFVTLTAKGGGTYQWNTGATTASINAMQSSTYSVIVTANGCSATASQSVLVNPIPSVSLASPDNFISINANPVNLYGNPSGGIYSGSGVSGSSFNPKNAGLGKSTVSYSYTNASGCVATAIQSTIVYDTTGVVCATHINVIDTLFIDTNVTGITPPKDLNTIKVYPNPTMDHITINYGNFLAMNGYSLKITNSLGQVIFTSPINQQSSYIDLSKWSGNGVYFVNILDKQNNTIESRKIVLQ
jgi:hypothetical protein